ncbi:MAG: hypothetical protein GY913_34680 [Proteobacteria bacterium]|nr:hypothetical protein [Pseudomonadota bacterium]MCP4922077.1 hypothetical protein [Pseudomonadota bacterium]
MITLLALFSCTDKGPDDVADSGHITHDSGLVDSDCTPTDGTRVHTDGDGDGYGDPDDYWNVCDPGDDAVFDGTDCDDDDYDLDNDCSPGFEGTYTGTFEVEGTFDGTYSDSCSASGTVEVNEDGEISGTMTCSFSILGTQAADLTGESAEGEIVVGSIFTDTWTGSWTAPGVLEGTFEGETTYSGFDIEYSGTFEFER